MRRVDAILTLAPVTGARPIAYALVPNQRQTRGDRICACGLTAKTVPVWEGVPEADRVPLLGRRRSRPSVRGAWEEGDGFDRMARQSREDAANRRVVVGPGRLVPCCGRCAPPRPCGVA